MKSFTLILCPQPQTCNAGLLLLGALDRRTGFTKGLAATLRDYRSAAGLHALEDFLRQRVFGIVAGHADANDAARLRDEPIFRLLLNRGLEKDEGLASQPTLSRFEHGIGVGSLMRAAHYLADYVLRRQRKRVKRVPRVTLDLDPTDDRAHGQQVFSFFNTHYGHRVFLPVLACRIFGIRRVRAVFGLGYRTPDEIWAGAPDPIHSALPLRENDPVRPAVDVERRHYLGDPNLIKLDIQIVRCVKRSA